MPIRLASELAGRCFVTPSEYRSLDLVADDNALPYNTVNVSAVRRVCREIKWCVALFLLQS